MFEHLLSPRPDRASVVERELQRLVTRRAARVPDADVDPMSPAGDRVRALAAFARSRASLPDRSHAESEAASQPAVDALMLEERVPGALPPVAAQRAAADRAACAETPVGIPHPRPPERTATAGHADAAELSRPAEEAPVRR